MKGAMNQFMTNKNRTMARWLAGSITLLILLLSINSEIWSQPAYGDWYQVQAIEAADLGIENPSGLAFSPETNLLFTLSSPAASTSIQNFLRLNLYGDPLDTNALAAELSNPLNTAYYAPTESLFFFDVTRDRPEMVQVQIGPDGAKRQESQTVTRFNARTYGMLEAQGITFDTVQRRLYILDTGLPAPILIRVTADPGHSFDGETAGREGRIHRTRLSDLKGHTLRGLAYNPQNEHLYTFDIEKQRIYELTIGGDIVSIMNVAELNLTNPQGMVFAASADATDDPANMNLFLADSGSNNNLNSTLDEKWLIQSLIDYTSSDTDEAGQIVELSFRTAVAPTSLDAASLVNTIDTSKAAWDPSSPDPAGIAYRPATNGLLISDSEVEENHPDFQGFNVFESTTTGDLFANCLTTEFSNEPTGAAVNPTNGHIFFSDDNANAIFEVDLGPDGAYCTADDAVSALNTTAFSSNDPEGLGYGDNKLFISDGVNQEVYVVDLGADGVIGGNGADADNLESQFDTFALGLRDPEGMEYNSINDTLFIVSTYGSDDFLVETTTDGNLITSYDLSFLGSTPRSGLAYGPGSLNPANYTIYIASRGVDNGTDPNENDGKVYEIDIGPSGPIPPPTADFSGTPTNGDVPLTVDFTDLSTGVPTSWSWDFGDANTSTEQNPSHTYTDPGSYTVSLTVSNNNGSDSETKVDYIVVNTFVNNPPVAVDDSASAVVNTPVIVDAVANDTDVDGNLDPSSAAIISAPSNGIVGNNGDGTFTYTPNTNFQGVDSFSYQVCDTGTDLDGSTDGDDLCDTAIVTITVSSGANYRSHSTASTEDATQLTIPKPDGVVSGDVLVAFLMSGEGALMTWTPPTGWLEIGAQYSDGSYAATAWYRVAGSSEPNDYTWGVSASNEIIGAMFAVSGADTSDPINTQLRNGSALPNTLQVTTSVDDALLILWGAQDSSTTQSWSNPDGMTEHFDLTQTATSLTHAGYTGGSGPAGSYSRTIDGTSGGTPLGWLVAVAPSAAPANNAPTAVDDSATTNEDTAVTITVLANDSDLDGDSLTVDSVTQGSNGSVTINPDETVTYTPAANFNGGDSFSYTISDGNGGTATADVNITINAVNDAPSAADDSYTSDEDTTLNIIAPGVLANDSDVDSDPLSAVLVGDVANGSLTLNADGSFSYTPNANFNGVDVFTYVTNDGTADSNIATVTITVNPINDVPAAVDDSYATDEDTTLNVAAPGVLTNDSDPDGDTLTAVLAGDVSNGSLTLNSDGSFDYTPNANFNGPDSFTYTVNDGTAVSNVATVIITVNPVNDAPVAADDSATTSEATAVTITVLANDSDVDGDSLTVDSVTQGSNGSVAINPDDTVTYTPVANFNGADSFSYTISDGNGGTATANVNITVNPFNNTPTAVDDSYTTNEDAALNVAAPGVLSNDSDLDGDPLNAVLVSNVSSGNLTLNPDGSFSYTPNANFNGVDTFTYTANDGTADSNVATVTITINAVNDAPTAADDSYTSDEDNTLNITAPGVLANDSDVDGDPLNAVLVSSVTNGILTLNSDGSFTYAPNLDFNGVDTFTYAANDGTADSNTATVTITVNPVNDAPVAVDDSATTNEDTAVTITVLANDSDLDGDSLTVDSLTQGSNGLVAINPDETVTYTPAANFNGADSFNYTISDGNGGTATAVVNITVNAVNDAPTAADDGYTMDEDTTLNLAAPGVLANDSDPENDPLTAALVSGVSNGSLTLNPDGSFSYTPTPDYNGVDTFTYIASDGSAGSNTATVTITINPNETIIDSVAASETAVAGTVTGDYTNTHSDDGIAESILERESGGRPSTRYSYLEHKWIIDVAPGNIVTLYANAWSSGSSDGDSFIFAYSTNDVTYTDMFIVNNTSDGAPLSYILPSSIQGTVYIRVTDSNRSIGNVALDSIYVDHLYIRSESEPGNPPAAPTGLNAEAVSVSQISLTWTDNAADEDGFYIQRSEDNANWILVDTVGPDVSSFIDASVFPGNTYYYRVQAFNSSGSSDYSNTATATTPDGLNLTGTGYKVQGVHTVDLTWSGGNAASFDIYRDGILIASGVTGNTFTDVIGLKGSGSYQYQVCEAGNPINCSNIIQIDF